MSDTVRKMFFYNGNAHAFSGHFHRPIERLIEVQAAATLPTAGGFGTSRVENFRFNELVSFKAAYSYVSGSEQKEKDKTFYTTLVTTTVEGLNILDVVTADKVVARISGSYEFYEEEPRILFIGSKFENLQVAGCPVKVELDHEFFLNLDTFAGIRKEFASNAEFRKIAEDPFQSGDKQKQPEAHGGLLCSLVKDIHTNCPGIKRRGPGLVVPRFGTVYFAEVLAQHSKRTLTMIRLELGSPVCGTGIVAQTSGNGHHLP